MHVMKFQLRMQIHQIASLIPLLVTPIICHSRKFPFFHRQIGCLFLLFRKRDSLRNNVVSGYAKVIPYCANYPLTMQKLISSR